MNKNLKEAIEKGRLKRLIAQYAEGKIAQEQRTERQKFIDSKMPAARKWIKEKLFKIITDYEAEGKRPYYLLGSFYEDGIPTEAIYEAAKKIRGLKPKRETYPIYESAEYVGNSDPIYSIEWSSTNPNDNGNDR